MEGEEDGDVTGLDQAKPVSSRREAGFCFEGGGDNLAIATFVEVSWESEIAEQHISG